MICAQALPDIDTIEEEKTLVCLSESCISTAALQEEVEKRSLEGNLPFEMGLELIKRWSNNHLSY